MSYGLDQCRMCGKPILVKGPEAIIEWEQAQRKPPIPEAEWRKRGFLAAPTGKQLSMPWMGCCDDCGMIQMRKRWRFNTRGALLILGFLAMMGLIAYIASVAPH